MSRRVVLDTNVLIAALGSREGASFRLLSLLGDPRFVPCVSVPLALEYEDVVRRQAMRLGLTLEDIEDLLDYICLVCDRREIFYLWRPFLKDPKDDMVLEVAVEARCRHIITFNGRDFAGAEQFGIAVVTPREFLREIGEVP